MDKPVINLSLEYIDTPDDFHRTITIFGDDQIIVDARDISEQMDFRLSATTIRIVLESMKNKNKKNRLLVCLMTVVFTIIDLLTAGSSGILSSFVHSMSNYELNLKTTGNEANISIQFDSSYFQEPFIIKNSDHVKVISWRKKRKL
ncbi:hypothetical protein [Paenibacillus glycanilyticus]|uniref:Uncharacterized protein n=1 Tax=Paenibacillus glycanilyticus TaxID=126569 RepID=A0ABQ6GJ49_9BACL|nr:hypothetical protein [Paenibacillus glycanilyticus]GLX70515.1 hypothetical protein MU1_48610 [Paenibacillus glycanilyticus]